MLTEDALRTIDTRKALIEMPENRSVEMIEEGAGR
jgi:hypothetical protein